MRLFYTSMLLFACLALSAQTTLPTSFDFVSTPATLPTGWSTNTTASYTSGLLDDNGTSSIAGKLQVTDHHFTIHFFDEPGAVTYNIKSYGTPAFAGTFQVQESVNGTTWSTITSYATGSFTDQWTLFTANPNINSRYIRFILTDKISGTNVGLDNVTIAANVPTVQEINVQYQGNDVPNGTSIQFASSVGVAKTIKLGIENLGTGTNLTISGTSFSGSAASEYVVSASPSSIAGQSADTLSVVFTPSTNGSRIATLSIANNDANENPYTITLDGIGGTGASEPAANPSNFSTPILKTYTIKGQFTSVTADKYIVLFNRSADFADIPVDGMEYEIGQGIGAAKVSYIGTNTSFSIKEAVANTKYFVKVFAFNGQGQFTNYRTSDPLSADFETPAATMVDVNYYTGIDETQSSFVSDLHNTINPHFTRFYSNYGPDFVTPFLSRDTLGGNDVTTCVYSGNNVVFTPPFSWPGTGMNREHTLPASWMPSVGNSNTPEYQDYHHLFPTISTPNSQRSNHPLGVVVNVTNSFGDGKVGTDAQGNTVYEPRNAQKGDAARAMFYMNTAYHDPQGGDAWGFDNLSSEGPNQKQEVLKSWHTQDLPSAFEHARNDFLDSLQQNRNPFIDSAHFVCYINFKNMSYIATPDSACLALTTNINGAPIDTTDSTISVAKVDFDDRWRLYPNPAADFITVGHTAYENLSISIINLSGALVYRQNITFVESIDLRPLTQGIYFISLQNQDSGVTQTFKLIKE
jgi:NADH:ubiquinone oxidoreductase subunit